MGHQTTLLLYADAGIPSMREKERERKRERGEGEGERERVDYESASGPIDHQEFGNVYGQ